MTDPIADLLTQIRNAGQRRIKYVLVPKSIVKEKIVEILKKENFINNYEVVKDEKGHENIKIELRYNGNRFVIENLTRVSKPGIRRYVSYDKIPKILGGIGICIISTSKGIMTGADAREKKIGGELICYIY